MEAQPKSTHLLCAYNGSILSAMTAMSHPIAEQAGSSFMTVYYIWLNGDMAERIRTC